jgi:YVTN family beta-propeller protein
VGLAVLAGAGIVSAAVGVPRAQPALEGNRGPYDVVFSRDGARAYVTEVAEGTVAEIDARSYQVLRRLPTGGEQPAGLALTPDGKTLVVANSFSGTVALVDLAGGAVRAHVALPGMPYGVAVSPDGGRAYVTVSQLDEVAVLDLPSGKVSARIGVGRRPRALDLKADGKTLVVANLAGGSLSVINTETLKEEARVRLKGVNVRGVSITGNGAQAYATLMPAFNRKPANDPKEVWHNIVQGVSLEGASSEPGEDQWMDFARIPGQMEVVGTPDQHDIVVNRAGTHAWVASAGRDLVTRITINDRRRDAIWPISQVETPVGANPRGLALTPDEGQLWVTNHLGNSISVLDPKSSIVLRTIDLGKASRTDPSLPGQYLFHNAALTRANRFTCNSCHPDGGTDGLTWSFVHVADGFGPRNSRDLRTAVAETAPFRWSGFEKHLSDFIESEVTGLLGGPKPEEAQLRELEKAVRALRMPPNPYRTMDGAMTPAAERGRVLFEGKAGCAGCHAGPRRGGTGAAGNVGTTREGVQVDIPHLAGVYDSGPFLHDGRAATLEEVFEKYNEGKRHGKAHLLTAEERAAVLRYVREL